MDFSKHLVDSCFDGSRIWWTYEFPNGHSASVVPDPRHPFRFVVESTAPEDVRHYPVATTTGVGRIDNQGSGAVESTLAYLAGLPQNEAAGL